MNKKLIKIMIIILYYIKKVNIMNKYLVVMMKIIKMNLNS